MAPTPGDGPANGVVDAGTGDAQPPGGGRRVGEARLRRLPRAERRGVHLGWLARYTAPDTGAHVQLVTRDATVDAAYAEAQLGFEIVHTLITEEWGVRRFLVRAPDGSVINIVRRRG